MYKHLLTPLVLLCIGCSNAIADEPVSTAHYMANEGLMVVHGDTKVVFDPLFRNGFNNYQLLPKPMKEALFAGVLPFDGIDAVFISHYHGDHFSPEDILRLLKAQPGIRLYAPAQAVTAMRKVASTQDETVFERVTAVDLAYKDSPLSLEMEGLHIEAVRIPHSGWPVSRLDVENISWRVTLDETATVLHLGDADPNDVHFARDAEYWRKGHTQMAFPPYWFFISAGGQKILKNRIRADHSVGVHVPLSVPVDVSARPPEFHGHDLFKVPGETRDIPATGPAPSEN